MIHNQQWSQLWYCINTVCILKHYPELSVWAFEDNWHTESKMYSLWFTHPTHLHAWLDAFCPHPNTGVVSQGIGCPRSALPVNWSGPDSSLVHPQWKPQMRRSANAFIFIRGARDKVSRSFCAAVIVIKKALKPFFFVAFTVFVVLQVLSLSHVCSVSIKKLYWRLSSLTHI